MNTSRRSAILSFFIFLVAITVATLKIAHMPEYSYDGYLYTTATCIPTSSSRMSKPLSAPPDFPPNTLR